MKGHSFGGRAAAGGSLAGCNWLRLLLATTVAVAALSAATDAADARSLRRHADRRQAEKKEPPAPVARGQLLVAVSIGSQRLTVYDDGVPVAHSPVSTGMAGHSTPTGVFSVIQKNRYHRSNIYSGAPMPFMQRITWSGVALHAGVLPGYPASHGCIRLPGDFAARLWGMTKLGARVIVTRHDVIPAAINHARLAALQAPALAAGGDKRADLLRPIIASEKSVRPTQTAPVRTAEASTVAVASDASSPATASPAIEPVGVSATPASPAPVLPSRPTAIAPENAAPVSTSQTTPVPEAASPLPGATAADTGNAVVAPPLERSTAESPPAQALPPATTVSTDAEPAALSADDVRKAAAVPAETAPAAETTSAIDLALPTAIPAAATPTVAPADAVVAPPSADIAVAPPVTESETLAALPLDEVFVPPARPARPLRAGPISVFISRKDARLYVRKRFDPLFSLPITIKADQPIGTHVYTAAEGEAGSGLRWIAVSLPAELPKAAKHAARQERHPGRRGEALHGKSTPTVVLPPPSSAAEALDRIDVPADAVAQIAGLMSPGASIIISDHGLGDETGLETDFIVLSR